MNIQEQLQTADELLTYLSIYNGGGQVRMESDMTAKLERLYRTIFEVTGTLSLSCSSCVIFYLNNIASWYQTAHAKWIEDNPPAAPPVATTPKPRIKKST